MKVIIILLCLISLSGCASDIVYRDTYIRDTLVKVNPVIYRDTLQLQGDTVVKWAYRFHKKDTILKIKYYPRDDKMIIHYKTDTAYIPVKVPQVVYRESKNDVSTFDIAKYVFIGLVPFILMIIFRIRK